VKRFRSGERIQGDRVVKGMPVQAIHPSLWFKLFLCAIFLAACNQASPAVPTTNAADPTEAASATPPRTAAQHTATPTIPKTATALPPPSITPTPDLVATAQAGSPAQLISSQVSPDGLWWARVFSHLCPQSTAGETYGYDYLQLTDQNTGKNNILSSQLIHCGGLGGYGLAGRFWSHASRFYYFTDAAIGVPDGCGYYLPPLLRLDVTDWSITRLGMGTISPDGFKLASWADGKLVIWDINDGQIGSTRLPVENTLPGPIAWAPDGQSITYLLSEAYCPLGLTYVVRLNLSDFQSTPFYASQDPSFADIRWDTANRVILTDEDGSTWAYNFITGTLAHYQDP